MSPSEKTTSSLDGTDPFLISPESNDSAVSISHSTPVQQTTVVAPLAITALESTPSTVIPAAVMEYLPFKYQRQNKNDNTNPIPDNQSLQILLKETLGGGCRQGSLMNLLQLTEPLPPIIEGQGCEATTASTACCDCATSGCCADSKQMPVYSYSSAATFTSATATFAPSIGHFAGLSSSQGYSSFPMDSPKMFMKRSSMDHDMGSLLPKVTTSETSSMNTAAVSPASLASINPLATGGYPIKATATYYGALETPRTLGEWNSITSTTSSNTSMITDEDQGDNSGCESENSEHSQCSECAMHDVQQQLSIVPRPALEYPLGQAHQLALVPSSHLAPRSVKKTNKKDDKEYIDLTPFLNMPQSEAARRLSIPTSSLSKKWKEAAFDRKWPYRTVCKIDKEIMALLHNTSSPLPPDVEQTLGMLVRKRQDELRPVIIRK